MGNRVFFFHDVYDRVWFEKIILIFKERFNIVSINDLEDYFYKGKKLNNSCHITIDDGDKTFYEVIYPILKKNNIPATLFVSPNICLNKENFWFQEISEFDETRLKTILSEYLNQNKEMLEKFSVYAILKSLKIKRIKEIVSKYNQEKNISNSEFRNISIKQLIEIDKDGLVTIGAHTVNHPILANENAVDSKWEIVNSFDGLEKILGHKIKYFAYPNGVPKLDFGDREINVLKEKDCLLSFTTSNGSFSRKNNSLAIPRIDFFEGNENNMKFRILIRPYWKRFKRLYHKDEIAQRIRLNRVLK